MNTQSSNNKTGFPINLHNLPVNRGMAFGVIIIAALLAFEVFNYSTTDFALTDLLGDLRFAGLRWATILSIAFCGIDFAGIARLFTPEGSQESHNETWYLFGAWLLAATMNAMLTWWGVSLAILNHETLGNAVIGRETLLRAVPVFVALLVWLIRVLIIGTFSAAGDRLFAVADQARPRPVMRQSTQTYSRPSAPSAAPHTLSRPAATMRAEGARNANTPANFSRTSSAARAAAPASMRSVRPSSPEPPEPPPLEPSYQPFFSPTEYADAEVGEPYPPRQQTASRRF